MFLCISLAVNKYLEGKVGKYCFGDEITLADAFLVPMIGSAQRFNVDLSALENVNKVSENLKSHPAFEKAHPKNQPDSE